jgi:hypothetical protein
LEIINFSSLRPTAAAAVLLSLFRDNSLHGARVPMHPRSHVFPPKYTAPCIAPVYRPRRFRDVQCSRAAFSGSRKLCFPTDRVGFEPGSIVGVCLPEERHATHSRCTVGGCNKNSVWNIVRHTHTQRAEVATRPDNQPTSGLTMTT